MSLFLFFLFFELSLFDSMTLLKCYSEYVLPDSSFLFMVRDSQFSRWQRPHLSIFAPPSVCQQKIVAFPLTE